MSTCVICEPRSGKSRGSTEPLMPTPMKLRLPASSITAPPSRLARLRSISNSSTATIKMMVLKIML